MKKYLPKFINKRKCPRAPIEFNVCYTINGINQKGKATMLSKCGVFIKTSKPAPVGTRLEINFFLPEVDGFILVNGKVRWTIRNGIGTPGMGIQFLNLDRFEKTAIGQFIEDKKDVYSQLQYLLSFKLPPVEWVQNLIKRADLPKCFKDFDLEKLNLLRNRVNTIVKRFS